MVVSNGKRVGAAVIATAAVVLTACGSSGSGIGGLPQPGSTKAVGGGVAGIGTAAGGASSAVCAKLSVADAQALVRPKLPAAVVDTRLGGCTFVLPGNDLGGSNLTVAIQTGAEASKRYAEDVSGTFSAGGRTVNTGSKVTAALSGVGDKAMWGSVAGYPTVSAIKGSTYCEVLPADDATKLTIIGSAQNPVPEGTKAQQLQYAQLEGKLCTDVFGLVS